jgi:hypothetical protein
VILVPHVALNTAEIDRSATSQFLAVEPLGKNRAPNDTIHSKMRSGHNRITGSGIQMTRPNPTRMKIGQIISAAPLLV